MAQMVFEVVSVGIEPNELGVEMRRVRLRAVEGEAFGGDTRPSGTLDIRVTRDYAKGFAPGDRVTAVLKERE